MCFLKKQFLTLQISDLLFCNGAYVRMYLFLQPKVQADLEKVCKLMGNYSKEVRVNAFKTSFVEFKFDLVVLYDEPIASCC